MTAGILTIVVNEQLPAVTAQDAGREVYHGRQESVQIIGDEVSSKQIAWIFSTVPDLFEIQLNCSSLIVRRAVHEEK